MQDLYATTFTLAHTDRKDAYGVACGRIADWIAEKATKIPLADLGSGEQSSGDAWTVRWGHRANPDGSLRALDVTLEHPDSLDANLRWRAAVVLTCQRAETRLTIRVSRGSVRYELRPRPITVAPPRLVAQVLRRPLLGYAGALEVTAKSRALARDEVSGYVADVIRHPERVLPVVLCDVGATAPADLAKLLVGVAHVANLRTQDAWEALKEELGNAYVPYGGARLYWPGFGSGDGLRHPYFTRAQLRQVPLERRLGPMLMRLSVGVVPRDRIPDRLRVAALREQTRRASEDEIAARIAEVKADEGTTRSAEAERITVLEATVADLRVEADEMAEMAEGAFAIADGLESDKAQLETELARTNAKLTAFQSRFEAAAEGDEEEQSEQAEPAPDEWGETFVERLRELSSPAFAVTDRAFGCAQRNSYRRPEDMFAALVGLERVARAYHEGDGRLGVKFVEEAKRIGDIRVARQDSSYKPKQRRFEFEGEVLDRLPHVKVDDHTAPTEVGRIYFAIDSANSRIVVDWFGVKQDRPT